MKRIFTNVLLLIYLFLGHSLIAQSEKCAFDKIMDKHQDNPIFQQNRAKFEQFVKQYKKQSKNRTGGSTVTIPCVIHVIHTGQAVGVSSTTGANPNDAQIMSAINDMNAAFKHQGVYDTPAKNGFYDASTNLQFTLAQRKPDGTTTTGIIRHNVSGESWGTNFGNNGMEGLSSGGGGTPFATVAAGRFFPPSDYMNIWLVHKFDDSSLLGFAGFPKSNQGSEDGLVMRTDAFGYDPENDDGFILKSFTNLNGTCNHEVGHYLSLFHTFEGDTESPASCPSNTGNGCGNGVGDCCGDVPAHIRSSGCPTYNATGNTCTGGDNKYIYNFMDYSDDACFHGFSNDQKVRMEATIAGPRKAFCTSLGATAPSGTYPAAPTATPTVSNMDQAMGIYDVTLNGTTFSSLSSSHDGGYINRVASQATVQLNHSASYLITVQVGVGNNSDDELAAVYIDYNNDGDFMDVNEQIGVVAPGDGKKNGEIHTFNFVTPSSGAALTGQRLRMRIISDFDDGVTALSSSTSVSQGGQIEDYSVQLAAALPVEMTAFDAKLLENNQVKISWTTASEINNSHFEVEKSQDEQQFAQIARIIGKGNSNETQFYQALDEKPEKGTNYYRLKQVDIDGTFSYSDIKVIVVKDLADEFKVYPNPISNSQSLRIETIVEQYYQFFIFDAKGQEILSKNLEGNAAVNLENLTPGFYFYKIQIGQNSQLFPFQHKNGRFFAERIVPRFSQIGSVMYSQHCVTFPIWENRGTGHFDFFC